MVEPANNTPQENRATEVDLSNCDREPIHIPGAIQPHGALLALDDTDLRVVQVSANCGEFLGTDVTEILGNPLDAILGVAQASSFRQTLHTYDLRSSNPLKLNVGRDGAVKLVNGIVHRHQGVLFLELEPTAADPQGPLHAYQLIQNSLRKIERTTTLTELWRLVAEDVQAILGYDRVMVYKFDRAGNGSVIEEQVIGGHEPYLGLHYPASDIPQQARVLYSLNYVRHIPDINYKPSELIPLIYPVTRDLTDLSYSTLRSVSAIHVEYLQNMGVAASISISIMAGSALWGLIACHNYTPKFVPYETRVACELLGQVVSSRMVALENTEQTRYRSATHVMQAKFLEAHSHSDASKALLKGSPNLLDYIPAQGAALCIGEEFHSTGDVPPKDELAKITRRLRRIASPIFATDNLSSVVPGATEYKDVASGMLSITISKDKNIYIMWFRPEQIQTVHWAGDPHKVVEQGSGFRLHPRKSFALWKETVVNRSIPWAEAEIQSATELRSTMMGLLASSRSNQE